VFSKWWQQKIGNNLCDKESSLGGENGGGIWPLDGAMEQL